MRRDEWTPAMRQRLERLAAPHCGRVVEDCLACTLDLWAYRAVAAARAGRSYYPGRVMYLG